MAPKKKGGKGKSGGLGGIIDGVDTSQMSREQLEVFSHRIREENEREREERNFFQLERDKLRNFWEITKNELEETRAKLRNKDRQIEEADEKNEEEIKVYKQKVKHLQYEHQNNLTECKAEAMVALKLAQDEHIQQERELLRDKRELKKQLREQETSHQDQVKSLKLQHSLEISKALQEFERKAKEIELKYEKKFAQLMQELETKQKMEMSEVEERKNCQISALTKSHEQSFNDMKTYYNDITLNNLALISSLKDEMEIIRKQNEKMAKEVAALTAENRKLTEPLTHAQVEVAEFKKQLENYKKDKLALTNTKAKLHDTKKELDELRWANEALELRFENAKKYKYFGKEKLSSFTQLQAERDELHKKFVKAILDVQQKTGLKNVVLQKRIQTLNNIVECREVIIGELTAASEVPPQRVNKKLEEMLSNKNATIKDLQNELSKVCKAYNDLLEMFEEKLAQYGVPKHEIGFRPIREPTESHKGISKEALQLACPSH